MSMINTIFFIVPNGFSRRPNQRLKQWILFAGSGRERTVLLGISVSPLVEVKRKFVRRFEIDVGSNLIVSTNFGVFHRTRFIQIACRQVYAHLIHFLGIRNVMVIFYTSSSERFHPIGTSISSKFCDLCLCIGSWGHIVEMLCKFCGIHLIGVTGRLIAETSVK